MNSDNENGTGKTDLSPYYGGPCPHRGEKGLCGLKLYIDPVVGHNRLLCACGHKFVSNYVTSSRFGNEKK